MLESIILGAIQGIAEWLPISSEGLIFLVKTNFFASQESVMAIAEEALFLHLGTFLAALIYFRQDVIVLLRTLFNYKSAVKENQNALIFIISATLISGILGFGLLALAIRLGDSLISATKAITLAVGLLLLVTAYLQLRPRLRIRAGGLKQARDIKKSDSIILGFVQGLAVLPGLSRSGLTVAALLLRGFKEEFALKLSFLLSLPIVLGGNIILNLDKFIISVPALAGLATSFLLGILTINLFLRLARRINFGYFVLGFGLLMILAVFV